MQPAQAPQLGIVLKGYPRLSETFIAQEIKALENHGLNILLISLRHPTDQRRHPIHEEIQARVLYLPEYLYDDYLRVLRSALKIMRQANGWKALRCALLDWLRDRSLNRLRRFGQALVLAAELPAEIKQLYAHFLHTPASVTRYAAVMLGLPWSVSAHAKDIWTIPNWEKYEKLRDCQWLVSCTRSNVEHLQSLADDTRKVDLVYHGLDLTRFPCPPARPRGSTGNTAAQPVQLLSVGRAVPKKGYTDVLAALSHLDRRLHWRFTHIGGGELCGLLRNQAEALDIADRCAWLGPQSQPEILQAYRAADIFILASIITANGDRDGLPNVLMEAQSQGLACIATDISGIPELIVHGETGLLVPPHNSAALAEMLSHLIKNPDKRAQLGTAGQQRVQRNFNMQQGIKQLLHKLNATPSQNQM